MYKKAKTAMRKTLFMIPLLFVSATFAVENPIDRWANAIGGRNKVAAIKSIYREATLEYGGAQGTIKVWHTADGKYRKEEQIATYSIIETFDGVNGTVQQGDAPPHQMTRAELEIATSKRFSNSNAMLFAFFPERRRGSVTIEGDNTIVLKPEGGIEWHTNIINRAWWPLQVAAGVKDRDGKAKYTGLHALRHFYASWCINREADGGLELPAKVVQERLGHSSITVTLDTYGHLFPRGDDSAKLAEAESRLWG